jgi:diadenosine hexaphosphate hydrolase (ATP-forming)
MVFMKKVLTLVEGAGGIVFNQEGKVLVLRHKNGNWVFPKGHIDPGETSLQAAIREVEEEGGVFTYCPNPDLQHITRYANARSEERVITWFLLLTEATKAILREDIFPGGKFFHPAEAERKLAFHEDRELLRKMVVFYTFSGVKELATQES